MKELTEILEQLTRDLESDYGLTRDAVYEGKYRIRRDRRISVSNPDMEMARAIAKYELAVTLLERFGKTEKDMTDRAFVSEMINTASRMRENPMLIIQEGVLELGREKERVDTLGRKNASTTKYYCLLIAAAAMRIRDESIGAVQKDEGIISIKTG